jgi:putative SOS response-associated peptidase YedK
MCGRFTLRMKAEALAEHFEPPDVPWVEPRSNSAPTPEVAVVRPVGLSSEREVARVRW